MGFSILDLVIVALYLIGSVAFGAWIGRGQKDTADYFLGPCRWP
jgi:Na+/proline symporter